MRSMASVENVAAGARAVFFSVAYPDPQDGFSAHDAQSVFDQLDALYRASRAIADPQWLGSRVEQAGAGTAAGDGAAAEPPAVKPSQEPRVRRIHMDWRHIEVVSELPWEFIVGGGLVGLVTMTEAVATVPPGIAVRIAQLSAEQADWKGRRTPAEDEVIDLLTADVLGRARMRPAHTQLYLGEEDEFEGWTA
ncbi:MAG: hypothetical protein QOD44_3766 [Solirubrobacteraceae bacterium]|nr:hypothetical protein [Solirubrobacteraceae bacterium]